VECSVGALELVAVHPGGRLVEPTVVEPPVHHLMVEAVEGPLEHPGEPVAHTGLQNRTSYRHTCYRFDTQPLPSL